MRSHRWVKPGQEAIVEYPTYGDLPASASDDTLVFVQGGGAKGFWQFLGDVDGYAVDFWLPAWAANRITGYITDSSSNPYRIAHGETKAQLLLRGFSDLSTGGATVGDHANGIHFLSGGSSGDWSHLQMQGASEADGAVFVVAEIDCVNAPASWNQAGFRFADGNHNQSMVSWGLNGVENRFGFHDAAASSLAIGTWHHATAYEKMLGVITVGPNDSADVVVVTDREPLLDFWPAAQAREQCNEHPWARVTSMRNFVTKQLDIRTVNYNGFGAEMIVRELHFFRLSV